MPVVTLAGAIPLTIGGFGLRELVSMEVYGALGVSGTVAAVATTLTFLGANVFPALALLAWSQVRSHL
jgi:hypothetical protein